MRASFPKLVFISALGGARPLLVRLAIPFATLCAAGGAHAQTSGSIGLVSDNSYRGYSLSGGSPSLQLRVEHEGRDGWYGGAYLATVSFPSSRARAQWIAYGGYARRLGSSLSWELGASRTAFVHSHQIDFTELYAGLAGDRAGVRLYFSPASYGAGKTAYLEVNGVHPLGERWRLAAHVGVLHRIGGQLPAARNRLDLRLALETDVGPCAVQLSWIARQHDAASGARPARALNAAVSYPF